MSNYSVVITVCYLVYHVFTYNYDIFNLNNGLVCVCVILLYSLIV